MEELSMAKIRFSLVMFSDLLKQLEEDREIKISEFNYGEAYVKIATAVHQAVLATREYSIEMKEVGNVIIITLLS
jgi:hypothetical protein